MNTSTARYIDIIDDHQDAREALVALLSAHGFKHLRSFSSGQDYIEQGSAQEAECIITDLRMSGKDGYEVLTEVKQLQPHLPVIVVSAFATVGEAVKIMKAGADTLIQKPYQDTEILQALDESLTEMSEQARKQEELTGLQQRFQSLTEEEVTILEKMIAGLPTKSIAYQLDLSTRTVDRRRTAIHEKLGAKSLAELAMMFVAWQQADSEAESR